MASQEVLFAGFGGQGILSMGKFLAYAGMEAGLNVSWLPSYGPEMRGGTANCSVILTHEAIGSPVVTRPTSLVVMNRPSLDKFEDLVAKGGLLLLDRDLVSRPSRRGDLQVLQVPAQTMAEGLGNKRAANMVLLGAFVEATSILSLQAVLQSVREHGKPEFFELNKQAIELGARQAMAFVNHF